MKKFGRFLFGAFFGALIGSSIIILFAPESGAETKKAIKSRLISVTLQIKEAIAKRKAELLEEIENYKESSG